MSDEFTLTLNSPITEEQWDIIADTEFEHTDNITFHTKGGREVKFVKQKSEELKPCPFCGGEAHVCHAPFGVLESSYVECGKCYARSQRICMSFKYSSDRQAIEEWNRRVVISND